MPISLLLFAALALAEPAVRLVDAGSEPRAPLRLEVPQGYSSLVDIRMGTSVDLGMGAAMNMPPMRLSLRFDAKEASADHVRYAFEIVDVGVDAGDPMMKGPLEEALKPMVGFAGEASLDARGNSTGLVMKPPPGLPKELAGNLDQGLTMVGAPLPVEPVGVGARWSVDQDVDQQGLKVKQTTTWTLVSREGSLVILDTEVQQTAPPQEMNHPNLTPGSTVKLSRFDSKGTGRTELDLRSLVPNAAMSMPMDMNMGVEMTLSRRAADPR